MTTNPSWQVTLARQAERSLQRLPRNLRDRIRREIFNLAENPRPHGCVKLSGHDNLWRIRVSDWRIVYAIHDAQLIIVVIEIQPRGSAYRNL
jgi:mRNA interferase RelE/StbE